MAFATCATMLLATSATVTARHGPGVPAPSVLVYFGTRAEGPTKGVSAARFDPATGELIALQPAIAAVKPTWLLTSPDQSTLYAVSEVGNDGKSDGRVVSYAADPATGRLTPVGSVDSGGGGATFLAFDDRRHPTALLVANYGSGDVGVVPIGRGGALEPVVSRQRDVGSGPLPRQAGAHPHGVVLAPSGHHALVADLGADRIFVYGFDPLSRTLAPAPAAVALPPGSGPRHIVFHPNGRFAFANAELTGEVLVLRWDSKSAVLALQRSYATRGPGYAGELSSAELAVSADGRFLYVSNRGEDVMLVYAIDVSTGALSIVQRIASGGRSPVGFVIDPTGRWLIVANEGSNHADVFRRSAATGRLEATGRGLSVDDPAGLALMSTASAEKAR